MHNPRIKRESSSRSVSRSPLPSPGEERIDPFQRSLNTVAFVPFDAGAPSGVSHDTRRAVRVQAAKASAATRKRTIARKLAEKRSPPVRDEASSSSASIDQLGRRTSATSVSGSDHLPLPDSPALSRSPSTGDLHASYRPYPVTKWHAQIPHIVDYFERYFLPQHVDGQWTHGREAMRTQLWPAAMTDTCLFHAILLVSASHATVSSAQSFPVSLLAQLKHTTIEHINEAIAKADAASGIGDAVIGSIALMGSWELYYGDTATYDTHMGGLIAIVNNMRGGLTDAHSSVPPVFVNLVLGAGHDLALYASKRPFIDRPGSQDVNVMMMLHSTLPAGLEELKSRRLVIPSLLHLLGKLSVVTQRDSSIKGRLDDAQQSLTGWSLDTVTATDYCATNTIMEDFAIREVCAHMRLAGLAVCGYLRLSSVTNGQDLLHSIYAEALVLQSEVLLGTVFEEVVFWALVIVCSTTGRCETKHMRCLKRLQLELGVQTWIALRDMLARYVYPTVILDSRAYALWEAVSNSTVARDPSTGMRQPSRFAKSVTHPTTQLGVAILAEEG